MVGLVDKPFDARHRNGPDRIDDPPNASPIKFARSGYLAASLIFCASVVSADTFRLATFNVELTRKAPGLLLRDIARGEDAQVQAVVTVLNTVNADIIALQGVDWDFENRAIKALNAELASPYPHLFAGRPNTGVRTDLDMDGDGRLSGPGDAQGFGDFAGQSGMAVLSRHPIDDTQIHDLTDLLWDDLPNANRALTQDGKPFPSPEAAASQRLSSTAHWAIPIRTPSGKTLTVLTHHATPPVFDGPEDQNGKRNSDELRLWIAYLEGQLGIQPATKGLVFLGDTNLDPKDGDGLRPTWDRFLAQTRFVDPEPSSTGGEIAAQQGGANDRHRGDAALDTVDWRDDPGPGNLRVDFAVASKDLPVLASGVFWPTEAPQADIVKTASRHRLVWLDVEF